MCSQYSSRFLLCYFLSCLISQLGPEEPARFFFFFWMPFTENVLHTVWAVTEYLMSTDNPHLKRVPVCFPQLDGARQWTLFLWRHFRMATTETLITATAAHSITPDYGCNCVIKKFSCIWSHDADMQTGTDHRSYTEKVLRFTGHFITIYWKLHLNHTFLVFLFQSHILYYDIYIFSVNGTAPVLCFSGSGSRSRLSSEQ